MTWRTRTHSPPCHSSPRSLQQATGTTPIFARSLSWSPVAKRSGVSSCLRTSSLGTQGNSATTSRQAIHIISYSWREVNDLGTLDRELAPGNRKRGSHGRLPLYGHVWFFATGMTGCALSNAELTASASVARNGNPPNSRGMIDLSIDNLTDDPPLSRLS